MIDKCIYLGLEKVVRRVVLEGQIALRRRYIFLPVLLGRVKAFFLASIKCGKQLRLIHAMSYFFWVWLPLTILAGEKTPNQHIPAQPCQLLTYWAMFLQLQKR